MEQVLQLAKEATKTALSQHTDVFSAEALKRASAEFFGLGWSSTFFESYTEAELSEFLYGYLCAKVDGSDDKFYFATLDRANGGFIITTPGTLSTTRSMIASQYCR